MPIFSLKRKSSKKNKSNGILASASLPPEPTNSASSLPPTNSASSLPPTTSADSLPPTTSNKPPVNKNSRSTSNNSSNTHKYREEQKLIFHCQLAHGSPTGLISGFSNVKELYQKIADCFEIPVQTILFCTLNTHKIEMNKLLGGQIGLDDFIFAHVKGQTKEIEIVKSEPALGLTITDNGAGFAFIKRIKEGSVIDRMKNLIKIGDHIEKINDKSIVGTRHFEVAKLLKEIPEGSTFKLRLIEPNAFGFQIEPAKRGRKNIDIKNGTKTLRFKADGRASIEEADGTMDRAIERINGLLETYMGINDADLAQQIWDLADNKKNPSDFATAIDESDLGAFNFADDFIFDLWAAIDDIKVGRIQEEEEEYESERL